MVCRARRQLRLQREQQQQQQQQQRQKIPLPVPCRGLRSSSPLALLVCPRLIWLAPSQMPPHLPTHLQQQLLLQVSNACLLYRCCLVNSVMSAAQVRIQQLDINLEFAPLLHVLQSWASTFVALFLSKQTGKLQTGQTRLVNLLQVLSAICCCQWWTVRVKQHTSQTHAQVSHLVY